MKDLIYPDKGNLHFSIKKTGWLYFMMLPCLFINYYDLTMDTIIVGVLLTLITVCIGHSVGLHRGVIHQAYKSSNLVKNIFVYLFVLTGLGGPISWIKLHYYRDYWQSRVDCPKYFAYDHSLLKDYWWNLHLKFTPENYQKYSIPKEVIENKWFLWLEKTWYLHVLFLALIIYLFTNFNTMLLLIFFRTSLTIIGHWYIGFASHKYGYSFFEIKEAKESAFNDAFLELISFGEGFHNNHHAHPSSANFSVKWYEFDLGWQMVKILKYLKIIYEVKDHSKENTLKETAIIRKKTLFQLPCKI